MRLIDRASSIPKLAIQVKDRPGTKLLEEALARENKNNAGAGLPACEKDRRPQRAQQGVAQARRPTMAGLEPSKKVYLVVPFKEKKDAMGVGAQFDRDRNRWCAAPQRAPHAQRRSHLAHGRSAGTCCRSRRSR